MIIVTGGAGFIGSCFLWKLNQEKVDSKTGSNNSFRGMQFYN